MHGFSASGVEIHLSAMNAIRFVAAVLVTGAAGLAVQVFIARFRYREFSLLYLGLGAGAYAARLLLIALGQRDTAFALLLTLFLPIPLILFMVETVAPEWKKAALWIIVANLMVAVFSLLTRILHWRRSLAWDAIDIFSLVELPLIIGMLFFPRRPPDRDLRIARTGIIIFLLFGIYTNFQGLGWAPLLDLEFIGFIIALACLADVALRRILGNEERLLSLHKELEIARNIQAQLLPEPVSRIGKLEVASRYLPATSVAGDFYDFLVQDGSLGVLLADVSGHGIPAALSASMVKLAIRAQAADADKPGEVLQGMNSILCGNLQGQFVTAAYLFLDPTRKALLYAGAGHPPSLIYRSCNQQIEALEENGLPLGILAGGNYSQKSAPLGPGDRCVLYTDGLLEATCPAGEEFGPERLQGFLRGHSSLSAQAFCDALVGEITLWCGSKRQPQDDLTVVAIDFPSDNNGS